MMHPPSDFSRKVADEYKYIKDRFHADVASRATKPDKAIVEQIDADLDHLIDANGKR